MREFTFPGLVLIGCLLFMQAGCASKPAKKTALMDQLEDVDVSKRELQSFMYRYGYYYAGQVDLVADEIYENTTNPQIRHSAIQWNTVGVSEMLRFSFNHEPMVALVTSWAYAVLLREFFQTGNGKDVFGPYQDRVVRVSAKLEQDLADVAKGIMSPADVDTLSARIHAWTAGHPIRNQRYVVEGFSGRVLLAAMGAGAVGGLGSVGSIDEQLVAMTDRTNLLMAFMPRQMQWQTAEVLSMSKEMISEVTDSTMAAMRREAAAGLEPLLVFLSGEREAFTRDIAGERAAVLEGIASERSAILEQVALERGEVFKEIARERNEAIQDLNALTLDALQVMVTESQKAVRADIDLAFRRLLQLLAVPFLGFVVFVLVVMVWVRNTTNRLIALRASGGATRSVPAPPDAGT